MNEYSPYERGSHPVGVKSFDITYPNNERTIPVECWYPATTDFAGQDLNTETQDKYAMAKGFPELPQQAVRNAVALDAEIPLIIFSHGFAGHRRQTTHFCCHLASHGYLVASPDHVGNTLLDIMGLAGELKSATEGKGLGSLTEQFDEFKSYRPADASLCIDKALEGEFGVKVNAQQIGITGHSFGGWTSIETCMQDNRIRAALPLAPAGGDSKNSIAEKVLTFETIKFEKKVPTLYLVADKDTLLPLDGMHDLYSKAPQPKKMLVLENSDHFHFCDNVEFIHDMMVQMGSSLFGGDNETGPLSKMQKSSELCSGTSAYAFIQGMGLAHMDAHVKNINEAKAFLEGDLCEKLSQKNIISQQV
jgi:dienelactone hydrolase